MTPDAPCFAETPSACHLSQQAHYSSSPESLQTTPPLFEQTHSANHCIFYLSQEAQSSSSQAPDSMTPDVPLFALTPAVPSLSQQAQCSSFPEIPRPIPPWSD